jgi:hypothetical protein
VQLLLDVQRRAACGCVPLLTVPRALHVHAAVSLAHAQGTAQLLARVRADCGVSAATHEAMMQELRGAAGASRHAARWRMTVAKPSHHILC